MQDVRYPHHLRLRHAACALALCLVATLIPSWAQEEVPEPGQITELRYLGVSTPQQTQQLGNALYAQVGNPIASYEVERYELYFATQDFDHTPVIAKAMLYIPRMDEPTERPMYVFGSGTTGVADVCAPSLEQPEVRRWGNYEAHMRSYAAQGFISIMPDYIGFNDPDRAHRYFSARAEAHVMLDAIRATYNFFQIPFQDIQNITVSPSDAVFATGYSQGGHAAFSAADLRPEYAPEVPLTGIIGYGSTTNVATLMREGPYYAPYITYAYAQMYGYDTFNPAEILASRWLDSLTTDVNRLCVDQMQSYYPFDRNQIYRPEFASALVNNQLAERFPGIYALLEENNAGLSGHGLPALVIHGEDDIVVSNTAQSSFARSLCERGSAVRYMSLPGVRHRDTRPAGFRESISWMEQLAGGGDPPSDCGSL